MLLGYDSDGIRSATRPHNSATTQRPAAVAVISAPAEIPDALDAVSVLARSSQARLEVVPQATGHGAGAVVDERSVLLDTSPLASSRSIRRIGSRTVGAGATWAMVNAAAERHGLLGLAGSAASVSVSGYAFGGGIGWLVRRDGLASGALRRVHYVDGRGGLRIAADDVVEQIDRDAIWAFRGAGGVGIAHTLEFDLVPVADLHAGALLWPGDALAELVAGVGGARSMGWAAGCRRASPSSTSRRRRPSPRSCTGPLRSISRSPTRTGRREQSRFSTPCEQLRRRSSTTGVRRMRPASPTSTWTRLMRFRPWAMHVGFDATTPEIAHDLLSVAAADGSPLIMMEIRHVAGAPTRRHGAVVSPPGRFIYHAVGALGRSTRGQIGAGFARARTVWSAADAGTSPGSWVEGAAAVPSALAPDVRQRARAISDAVDPDHRISRSRLLAGTVDNGRENTT